LQPLWASNLAVDWPMPDDAPVMSTTL